MKFTIRQANPADAATIAELFIRVRAQMAYLPRLHTDIETREFIAHVVETDEVWVATESEMKLDRVTGFAAIHDEPKKSGSTTFILHLSLRGWASVRRFSTRSRRNVLKAFHYGPSSKIRARAAFTNATG